MRVIFMHHPTFLSHANEADNDASLGNTKIIEDDVTSFIPNSYFHLPIKYRIPLLTLFQKYNFQFIFSGHFHQNKVIVSRQYNITQIVTSAVGMQ